MGIDNAFGLTADLLTLAKQSEGWSAVPYLDPVGRWTIGYGHLLPDGRHPSITQDEGEQMLRDDLASARDSLLALSPTMMNASQNRAAALTDWLFEFGAGHYAGSTLKRCVDIRDWAGVCTQLARWVYGHKDGVVVELPGLVTRRAAEVAMINQG